MSAAEDPTLASQRSDCPVCRSTRVRQAAAIDGYPMSRCRACGHLYVACAVPDHVLANAYGENYYASGGERGERACGYDDYLANAPRRLRGFDLRLRALERFVAPPGRILDFGCAVGLFVRAAQDRGWDAVGYDRSHWAAAYGREKLGVSIQGGAVPRFDPGSFDLITLWDCVEHLPDPRETLQMIHGWLRVGGVLALNTVNSSSLGARLAGASWRHIMPPLHLHLFSAASLRRLVSDTGFSIMRTRGEGVVFAAAGARRPAGALARVLDDVVCHWRLRPVTSSLNLRDEILLIARRTR